MHHYTVRLSSLLVISLALLSLPSCIPEYKIAKNFTSARQEINLLIHLPELVYKYNHKGELIEGFDSLRSDKQDSALWSSSRYIKFLSDSILLENYMNSFIDELRLLGFNVYFGNVADSFDATRPQSYVLDISQLQLDEYLYTFEDEFEFFDTVFVKRIILNAMDYSFWYDLRKANVQNFKTTVLYGTETSYDNFEGRFFTDPFTGNIRYKYSLDTLTIKDIYSMSTYVGKKHAGYLYDFFLNQYIARHMPEGMEMMDYYHFNRNRNMLVPANDERFEILGTK